MFVCMCDAYFLDPDTCDHDASTYYAFIHDPLILIHACMMHPECMCPDIYIYDACVNDAHICDPGP